MDTQRVLVFDTTLRDGEQAPGYSMNLEEKLRMARQLRLLGVDVLEAGFAIASPGDFEAVRAIAGVMGDAVVASLPRDIDVAWDAVRHAARPRIHTFLGTSDLHLQYKLRMTREDALEWISSMVAYARDLCGDVEFSCEDATRTDLAFLCRCVEAAIRSGATTINLPDTVGYDTPKDMREMFSTGVGPPTWPAAWRPGGTGSRSPTPYASCCTGRCARTFRARTWSSTSSA